MRKKKEKQENERKRYLPMENSACRMSVFAASTCASTFLASERSGKRIQSKQSNN
jgi:hypothetical protein